MGVNGVNVSVAVGEGVSVLVEVTVTGVRIITPWVAVCMEGGARMIGVAVITAGSCEGAAVHTGSG